MSKIRVYELARELNLTNKALMEKFTGLNITVASHMSTTDDDAVQRVKAALFGKKPSRGRGKAGQVHRYPAPQKGDRSPSGGGAGDRGSGGGRPWCRPNPRSRRRGGGSRRGHCACARVACSGQTEDAVPEEPPSHAVANRPNRPTRRAAVSAGEPAVPVATEKLRKGEKIVKKGQRRARPIIKLPVAPVEGPLNLPGCGRSSRYLLEPRGPKVVAVPVEIGPPAPGADDRDERSARRSGAQDEEAGKKFIKKKISFRTKAVVEAEDLYDEASRSRKPRKGGKAQPEVATHKSGRSPWPRRSSAGLKWTTQSCCRNWPSAWGSRPAKSSRSSWAWA